MAEDGIRPDHDTRETCVECGKSEDPRSMEKGPDGYVCARCEENPKGKYAGSLSRARMAKFPRVPAPHEAAGQKR